MPFQLSPVQEQVRKIAQEYVQREIIPRRKELHRDDPAVFKEQAEKQAKLGFHLAIIPREEGGTGLGLLAGAIVKEELSAGFPGVGAGGQEFAYYFARATGGVVKEKFMPGIIKGEIGAAPAITEPSGGSDPRAEIAQRLHCGKGYARLQAGKGREYFSPERKDSGNDI